MKMHNPSFGYGVASPSTPGGGGNGIPRPEDLGTGKNGKKISIVVVEDETIIRESLLLLLRTQPDFAVVGEAGDGLEAMSAVDKHRPDILIMDLMLPRLSGLEVARQVASRYPQVRVVILSGHLEESYVMNALKTGVGGYVLKSSKSEDLFKAIREAVVGRCFLSPAISERTLAIYLQRNSAAPANDYETLSERERVVLQMASEGRSSAEIGTLLGISPRTVESHRARSMQKLGLHSQTELVLYMIKNGLMKVE